MLKRLVLFVGVGMALAGCQENAKFSSNARARAPIPAETQALMREKNMSQASPILVRIFKKESELEVWKKGNDGRFALLKTYPICRWSGQLGPKKKEGDRQAPEGFYTITPGLMNPNSSYYLSFDMGYPNAFDRANGRTGKYLMVHGACSSAGCYSMTDEQIAEIYALGREAFNGGQRKFQVQAYPFRMTPENMAKHRLDPNIAFWRNLKEGSDHFETTRLEPAVGVCGKRYVFNARNGNALNPAGACPTLDIDSDVRQAVASKQQADEAKIADLLSKGTPAVRVVYQDGGQHPVFQGGRHPESAVFALSRRVPGYDPTLVSRPDALAAGPQEIVMNDEAPARRAPVTQVATAVSEPARTVTAQPARVPAVAPAAVPVPAPRPEAVAVADARPTTGATPTGDSQSLLRRMMSFSGFGIGGGSSADAAAPGATPAADAIVTAATPTPAAADLPPVRPADTSPTGLW